MYNYKAELKLYLDGNTQYRECLFKRGYLITDAEIAGLGEYPFYGQWSAAKAGRYTCFVHNDQQIHIRRNEKRTAVLIGHAYNPFDMQYDENLLLDNCLQALETSENSFFDKISEFTGIHLICIFDNNSGNILAVQDCSGMQSCYFGVIQGKAYITEYPQLLGDILNLKINPFVEKLVTSKCYNIGNRHLPGNLSPYKELKRLGGNTCLRYDGNSFSVNRFFPTGPHAEFQEDEYSDGIARIYNIIHNGIVLCTKKWDRRAISLSGGTDSKTTLACAAGLYDQFSYFSFYSKPQEMVDAQAAQKICRQLKVGGHTIYPIPEQNEEIPEYDFWRKLIAHNTNYIKNLSDNEIRKYVYLYNLDAYDIELKSWISETARVFLERKYQIKMPGQLTERHFSIFQTRYFMHPFLLKKTDRIYKEFMKETELETGLYNYEHTDLFYWEVRMGAWGTGVTSSQNLYHRVTMPMNNRKLLELFLAFPHDMRKSDKVHRLVMEYANQAVLDTNVEVQNLYFHSYRIWMEKLYYLYRTLFYKKLKRDVKDKIGKA